jgi:hypothetical protein
MTYNYARRGYLHAPSRGASDVDPSRTRHNHHAATLSRPFTHPFTTFTRLRPSRVGGIKYPTRVTPAVFKINQKRTELDTAEVTDG